MEILKVEKLSKSFGGVKAVNQVDMQVNEGEIVGLIGPNGAGKSTLFATISGFLKPTEGKTIYEGYDITGMRPDKIARKGIIRTFQIVRPINDMTVLENVVVGALMHTSNISKATKEANEVLHIVDMAHKADKEIRELTLADKKRLEVARALAGKPRILLFDEVMAGLNAVETQDAVKLIRKINKELHITMVIVEHVMEVIMPLSDRVVVLDHGTKIAEGTPGEVIHDENVIKAYLGAKKEAK